MGLKYRKSVFIASTLPLKLPTLLTQLSDADLIVCANQDLSEAIQEALELLVGADHEVTIRVVSNEGIRKFPEILLIVLRSRELVTTHECAWPSLDLSLVLSQRPTTRLRASSLKGMRRLSIWSDFRTVCKASFTTRGVARVVASIGNLLVRLAMNPIFEYYSATGVDGSWRAWRVRDALIRELDTNASYTLPKLASPKLQDDKPPLIVLAVSLPAADQQNVSMAFLEALKIILDMGYRCWIKDHPRKEQRLGRETFGNFTEHVNFHYVNPATPIEVLTSSFDVSGIVAIDSAALVTRDTLAISLLSLIDMPEERRLLIRAYLSSFDSGNPIHFVECWSELEGYLQQL